MAMEPLSKIAFIGLGNMGAPMVRRLVEAGYSLAVYDLDRRAQEELAATCACQSAPDAGQAAQGCQMVITMLPHGKAVRQAVLGSGEAPGLAQALAPGAVLVDMSSSAPLGTQALGQELAAQGIEMLDAPVSGGVTKAISGQLSILVGGRPETVEYCRPVLAAMGQSIFATGPLGSAHALKALNNMLSAAGLVAAAEVLLVGKRFGLDPDTMIEVFNASTGMNNSTKNKYRQFVLSRRFDSGFSLALMVKDLGLAMELARDTSTPVVLSAVCRELCASALAGLEGESPDHTEVARWLENNLGTRIES